MMEQLPPAGWYPDPWDAGAERWWDSTAWTAHARPRAVQPAAASPAVSWASPDPSGVTSPGPASWTRPDPTSWAAATPGPAGGGAWHAQPAAGRGPGPDARVVLIVVGLVVVAIAVGAYLLLDGQRARGMEAQLQSELRNAAVAMETHYTTHRTYRLSPAELERAGYTPDDRVELTLVAADTSAFCLQGESPRGQVWHYSSADGGLGEGPCP